MHGTSATTTTVLGAAPDWGRQSTRHFLNPNPSPRPYTPQTPSPSQEFTTSTTLLSPSPLAAPSPQASALALEAMAVAPAAATMAGSLGTASLQLSSSSSLSPGAHFQGFCNVRPRSLELALGAASSVEVGVVRAAGGRGEFSGLQGEMEGSGKRASSVAAAALSVETDSVTSTGSCTKEDIIAAESQLFVQTYARSPVVFVTGKGCKIYDTENNEYLDLTAGIAVNALGHGDPTWVKAVTEQAGKLAHVSNHFHTVPQVKLAERLVRSSFADRVFMVNSGTEANEAAMKFARKYHHALAKKNGGNGPGATEFIAFTNCFHGRTLGALSLTSKVQYRTPFEPLVPGGQFVPFGDLEATRQAVVAGKTAAIFVEPLQGEGGVCSATASFLKGLRDICDETGTLLVFDEVQCGLGRTGRLWAHEACDVRPDMMTLAKPLAGGLPIGAVLVTERVASSISAGDHGSTFAGGPLVCHAALAVLDRIQAPGFLESVAQNGTYLKSQLQEKLGKNSHVKEVRGEGLIVGIQLDVPASPLVAAALKAGLLILTAGKGDVVRLVPPLIISKEEIDQAIEILESSMSSLQ